MPRPIGASVIALLPRHGGAQRYIDQQEEHHRTRTFQEEYRAFLTQYGITFDERYMWD